MVIEGLKIAGSSLGGFGVLSLAGLILGEVVATCGPRIRQDQAACADALGLPYDNVAFTNEAGQVLRGWFFPAECSHAPCVLYAPGTSHDQRSGLSLVAPMHAAGYSVLLFGYRGHGLSDGSRFGFTYGANEQKDINAAVHYLYEQRGVEQVGVIGFSAGATAAILSAACNEKITAVVAAAPFASIEEAWEKSRPKVVPRVFYRLGLKFSEWRKGYLREQTCAACAIGDIAPRPVLLVEGTADERIGAKQTRALLSAGHPPIGLWLVKGLTHRQLHSPGLSCLGDDLAAFFRRAFSRDLSSSAEDIFPGGPLRVLSLNTAT